MPGPRSRSAFAAVAIALAAGCGAATAADLVPMRAYSWQGPYVGANLGYQWGTTTNNPTDPSGVAGGLQAGYNFQRGPIVFGIETDIQLSAAEDRFAPWKFSNPWFGTLRGRGGYALNNVMFYGTVGLAYGTLRGRHTFTGLSESTTDVGWTIGAGMEVALMATGPRGRNTSTSTSASGPTPLPGPRTGWNRPCCASA